jgi:hypothetical protein
MLPNWRHTHRGNDGVVGSRRQPEGAGAGGMAPTQGRCGAGAGQRWRGFTQFVELQACEVFTMLRGLRGHWRHGAEAPTVVFRSFILLPQTKPELIPTSRTRFHLLSPGLHRMQYYRGGAMERRGVGEGIRSTGRLQFRFGCGSGTERGGNDNVKGLSRRR